MCRGRVLLLLLLLLLSLSVRLPEEGLQKSEDDITENTHGDRRSARALWFEEGLQAL